MKLSLSWSWCDVDTAIASAGRRDSAEAGNSKIVTSLWNLYWRTLLEKRTSCYCSGVTSLWCIQNTFVSSADVLLLHILVFFWPFFSSVCRSGLFLWEDQFEFKAFKMPPKKAGEKGPSKKTEMKKKEKVIEVSESVLAALPKCLVLTFEFSWIRC